MKASKWDIMKLASAFEGEFDIADFSPEELETLLGSISEDDGLEDVRRKYFEFYDDIKDRTLEKHKWSD